MCILRIGEWIVVADERDVFAVARDRWLEVRAFSVGEGGDVAGKRHDVQVGGEIEIPPLVQCGAGDHPAGIREP